MPRNGQIDIADARPEHVTAAPLGSQPGAAIPPLGDEAMFLGLNLALGPNVLVPRKETELLARVCIDQLRLAPPSANVIDMCCGCGNLAVAIACHHETVQLWACDLTMDSVAAAKRNVDRFALQDRVTVILSDMFQSIRGMGLENQVFLVMCNPPYISSSRLQGDRAHLLQREPREAFDGGPYGISIQQRLVRDALDFLVPGGWLAFEFGEGQERQAAAAIARTKSYGELRFVLDHNNIPRVAIAQKLFDHDGAEDARASLIRIPRT